MRSGRIDLDAEDVFVLIMNLGDAEAGEEGAQVVANDLAWRPPERLLGYGRRLTVPATELDT